jgi:hypothetical protein
MRRIKLLAPAHVANALIIPAFAAEWLRVPAGHGVPLLRGRAHQGAIGYDVHSDQKEWDGH